MNKNDLTVYLKVYLVGTRVLDFKVITGIFLPILLKAFLKLLDYYEPNTLNISSYYNAFIQLQEISQRIAN